MIRLITDIPELYNELGEIIRAFIHDDVRAEDCFEALHTITHRSEDGMHYASIDGGTEYCCSEIDGNALYQKRFRKYAAKQAVYKCLCASLGYTLPWGGLTGVRPVKLLSQLGDMGLLPETVMNDYFKVSPERTALCRTIDTVQRHMNICRNEVSVYIGIPFCVSRCAYCSFPGIVGKASNHTAYLNALKKEMSAASTEIKASGRRINALYIGGGTPTSFSDELFDDLLDSASMYFQAPEFTVEAGRPDTISPGKLSSAKAHGVTRICVNPQTMNDATLVRIGRTHTSADIIDCYNMVRQHGFNDINMDLIAGLSGETPADFVYTLNELLKLSPDSVTVHTLSIKRGSRIKAAGYSHSTEDSVVAMVDYARNALCDADYKPYYLYRQKYMAGNLENVGYAKNKSACVYNVCMMDDLSDVLAMGMGSISKVIRNDVITRSANPKDLNLYLDRIDSICEKYDGFLRD